MKLEKIEGALKAQANKGGAVSRLLSRQPTTLLEVAGKARLSVGSGADPNESVSAQMWAPLAYEAVTAGDGCVERLRWGWDGLSLRGSCIWQLQ